jgi:membrane-bound serine protease (ClpP class)
VVADPNVAFVLMMIGIYGLIFEFLNPGAIAPGVLGGICLLVALFALNLLPINYAGAAFVLLGVGLLIAEAHIGSFGVIGLGGIVAFAIGAIMMFPPAAPGFILSPVIVAASTFATAGFFLVILSVLLRSRRRPVVTGGEALVGAQGEVVAWGEKGGQVRVKGEIWRARAAAAIEAGTRVRVLARDGLVLTVEAI